jgi:chromosome segregation ATPase
LDRSSRSLDKVRKYADRCKEEIAANIDEKHTVIKNYGISLEVERKAASELMRRIQNLTREELAQKVQALAQIEERIHMYDSTIEELVQMTGRVQENLLLIRDESAFVESVGKRVGEVKDKVERSLADINSISETLETMEQRFEQQNAEALENAMETAVSSIRSTVVDIEASAQKIERKVGEHRDAMDKLEQGRENKLARDEERIEKILAEAIDKAGSRADKVEEAALAKLREQAQDRLNLIKANFEEKMKAHQDTIKTQLGEIQEFTVLVKQQQEEQGSQLSGITNNAAALETEMRRSMQEATNRVNSDFARFGEEMHGAWNNTSGEYNSHLQAIREELAEVDRELQRIKEKAFDNVSKKLEGFEDEFLVNLSDRSAAIDKKLESWQEELDGKLTSLASEAGKSRKALSDQLERGLEEAKSTAENDITTKIDLLSLSVLDTLRQSQRDIETNIHDLSADTKEKIASLESSAADFHKNIQDWQSQYAASMRELDDSMENTRRRSRELAAENDEHIAAARTSMDDIRKELTAQAKLFDRTNILKAELDRYIEDMSSNMERISQLKTELTRLENKFTELKRLEDDVNAKMIRILSETHRVDLMEGNFNRLLQTSQSVDERLAQVSNSDDILQTIQVQIRRLEDVIKDTEEKYQRVERKNKTIQETNDGIDRNFRILQENEQVVKRLDDTVALLKTDMDSIQSSVEALSSENEKARDAAAKLSTLDDSVKWLEKRIAEMNVAREGLARLATELQSLEKKAQDQLKLIQNVLAREEGKSAGKASDQGAPPPRDRENIIKLKRQGWSVGEIARTMNISISEVELVLELGPKEM